MAAMAALQSSFTTLSLHSSSFFGQRLSPALTPPQIRPVDQPCPIVIMKLKRWERKKCKPNSLPILQKMHVKIGDTVKIIAGRDKGKIGEITEILKHNSKVVVKDINLKSKHVKTNKEDNEDENEKQKGQIVKVEAPVHSSNVMLYSKEQNVASRVGHKILENGSRVRYLIKTGEIIDSAEIWKKVIKEKTTTEVAVTSSSSSSS